MDNQEVTPQVLYQHLRSTEHGWKVHIKEVRVHPSIRHKLMSHPEAMIYFQFEDGKESFAGIPLATNDELDGWEFVT